MKMRVLATAAILLSLLVAGCVISPRRDGTPPTTPPGTGQGKLYVTNEATGTILRFDNALTDTGNIKPAATITGSQLSSPQYIALDTKNDRLYVASQNAGVVLIFDRISTKNGNISADRVIGGPSTGLSSPSDVAFDRGRDLLYVVDQTVIEVFSGASAANGDVTPVRTIIPQRLGTGFSISTIFLDTAGDRLYVADSGNPAVNVYDGASGLSGAVNANRSLTGTTTGLAQPNGLQVDGLGRLIVANNNPPSITVYTNAATLNGDVGPSVTVSGSSSGLGGPSQILVTTGNELYVADGVQGNILIYAGFNAATSSTSPTRTIGGTNTGLARSAGGTGPTTTRGIALDSTR